MDKEQTLKNIQDLWESWWIPGMSAFIKEDNLTPMVDDEYLTNGKIQKCYEAVD